MINKYLNKKNKSDILVELTTDLLFLYKFPFHFQLLTQTILHEKLSFIIRTQLFKENSS